MMPSSSETGLDRARAAPRDSMRGDACPNRWLLVRDCCLLKPFAAAGPIAVDRRWARTGAGDGAVIVGDGLDGVGVPDEPCLSPRVAISTNSNELTEEKG